MNVSHDVSARVFGNAIEAEFSDMDANGEHGLALALIATALEEVADTDPDHANMVGTVLARVERLVNMYIQRETPVQYV